MQAGAIENFQTESINNLSRCVLGSLILDQGVPNKLNMFHFGHLAQVVFGNDRNQDLNRKLTARYKVQLSSNFDSAFFEENDLFFLKFKCKAIFEFVIDGNSKF